MSAMSTKFRTYIRCENLITHVDLDLSIKYLNRPMEVPFYFEEHGKIVIKYSLLNVHDAFETEIKKRMIECDTGIFRGKRVFVEVGNGKPWQSGEYKLVKLGGRVADIIPYFSPEIRSEEIKMYKIFLIKFDNPYQLGLSMKAVYTKLSDFDEKGNVIFGPHLCSMRRHSFQLE